MVLGLGKKRINLRLPEELVRETDGVASVENKNRTELIKEALNDYLRRKESEDEFKDNIVDMYLDDVISFDVLKAVIGKKDSEAARASKEILEGGEDIAERMAGLE